ncbi:MAG: T9SS type A sorting domain-containing protein [Bacteroidales bacterium]
MKKQLFILVSVVMLNFIVLNAQVLNVPQIFQEQNQWCWAGVSKSVLDYYGHPNEQCTIAEYARSVITWYNFGNVDCCIDPNQGCNYWNYNYGYSGSIQDILVHFGNVQNYGNANPLSLSEIQTEITAARPFIVRWAWTSGGGHFVVGQGIVDSSIYYMNPWYGEGFHISTYNWLKNDGNHSWTHTNVLITSPASEIKETKQETEFLEIYPNPTDGKFTINCNTEISYIEISNIIGEKILMSKKLIQKEEIDLSSQPKGIYFIKIISGDKRYIRRILVQ